MFFSKHTHTETCCDRKDGGEMLMDVCEVTPCHHSLTQAFVPCAGIGVVLIKGSRDIIPER